MKKEIELRGRLGNVLFELANAYSNMSNSDQLICYVHKQQLPFINNIRNAFNVNFQIRLYGNKNKINFNGYCQSENLFDRKQIKQVFQMKQDYLRMLQCDFLSKFNLDLDNTVSISIRRGDYITLNGIWQVQPLEYYTQAIQKFFKGKSLLVSSDDVEYAKKNFKDSIIVNEYTPDPIKILCLLSLCKHHIGSASSFSWWISYLHEKQDSINIFPNKWYDLSKLWKNQPIPSEDIDQILPERWIRFKPQI